MVHGGSRINHSAEFGYNFALERLSLKISALLNLYLLYLQVFISEGQAFGIYSTSILLDFSKLCFNVLELIFLNKNYKF
jgi:hypothetical protein